MTRTGRLCFRFRNAAAPTVLAIVVVLTTDQPFLVSAALDPGVAASGAALVLAGLALRVAVLGAVGIRRSGRHCRMAAPRLHDSGPYGCCRHPLYLANGLLLVGLTLVFDSPWMVFLALPLALTALGSMMVAEERLLLERFGARYRAYAARVPRFGLRGFPHALAHGAWSWRRALRKEHGTVFAAGTAALVLLLVEHVDRTGVLLWEGPTVTFVAAWLALSTAYLCVRLLKWGGRLDAAAVPTPLPSRPLPALGDDGRS